MEPVTSVINVFNFKQSEMILLKEDFFTTYKCKCMNVKCFFSKLDMHVFTYADAQIEQE